MRCFGPHHCIVLLPFCLTCRLGDGVTFFEKGRAGLLFNAFRHSNWNNRAKPNATNKIIAHKPVPKHRPTVQLFVPSLTTPPPAPPAPQSPITALLTHTH